MRFSERDFTNQFISSSYQDIVQRYVTGSNTYFLDTIGYVIASIPNSSIGNTLLTIDQTASFSISASYAPYGDYNDLGGRKIYWVNGIKIVETSP